MAGSWTAPLASSWTAMSLTWFWCLRQPARGCRCSRCGVPRRGWPGRCCLASTRPVSTRGWISRLPRRRSSGRPAAPHPRSRASTISVAWRWPASRSAWRSGRWTWPATTPCSGRSSAAASGHSRLSSTSWRTCCSSWRRHVRRHGTGCGQQTPGRSRARQTPGRSRGRHTPGRISFPSWRASPRRPARRPPTWPPRRTCMSTGASVTPGSTRHTCTSGVPPPRGCGWATRPATTSGCSSRLGY